MKALWTGIPSLPGTVSLKEEKEEDNHLVALDLLCHNGWPRNLKLYRPPNQRPCHRQQRKDRLIRMRRYLKIRYGAKAKQFWLPWGERKERTFFHEQRARSKRDSP